MPPSSMFIYDPNIQATTPQMEVRNIISAHIDAMTRGSSYNPDSAEQLYDFMVTECTAILADRLINGDYTPMAYNDIRNELAATLWKIFKNDLSSDKKVDNLNDKIYLKEGEN